LSLADFRSPGRWAGTFLASRLHMTEWFEIIALILVVIALVLAASGP
jgi:hypothetical protein